MKFPYGSALTNKAVKAGIGDECTVTLIGWLIFFTTNDSPVLAKSQNIEHSWEKHPVYT